MLSKILGKRIHVNKLRRGFLRLEDFATINPDWMCNVNRARIQNYVNGEWKDTEHYESIIDPMDGQLIIDAPLTSTEAELNEFRESLLKCDISGLHNPLKNPERYNVYGDVCFKAAAALRKPDILDYFTKLIQRVSPKSYQQAEGEVTVTRKFLENMSGDGPRFILRGFTVAGDHTGQQSQGYKWPYGPVVHISPFNFPLEIPALQVIGALIAGNKVLVKVDTKVAVVFEQFIRLLLKCGMPATDLDMIHTDGQNMEKLMRATPEIRVTQFTGSNPIANRLSEITNGKVKIEDAGFDWKVLGPDVENVEYVAWQTDMDAYASSGQKCSAESILFAHENWLETDFLKILEGQVAKRNLDDLSIGPILTWTNEKIKQHIDSVLQIPGSKLLFGGKELEGHSIPECYGAFEPTAIFVPLNEIQKEENWELVTTELFGPYQIITSYDDNQVDDIIAMINKFDNHLTAGIVSNDQLFVNKFLSETCNGVTYVGNRARTTGAPANHWFGPCGDPRGAGIGTPDAIIHTWTSHREGSETSVLCLMDGPCLIRNNERLSLC